MSTSRILILGAETPQGAALIERLSMFDVYAASPVPGAAGLYLVPEAQRLIVPEVDEPDFLRSILRMAERNDVGLIVPVTRAQIRLFARQSERFVQKGIKVLAPEPLLHARCDDRLSALERVGADAARAKPAADAEWLSAHLDFEFVSRFDTRAPIRPKSMDEIRLYSRHEELFVRERLSGQRAVVDLFVSQDGRLIGVLPHEVLSEVGGVTLAAQTLRDEELVAASERIVSRLSIRGPATLTFERDSLGIPRLVDLLLGFSDMQSLNAKAGIDVVLLAVMEALEGSVPSYRLTFDRVAWVRHFSDHYISNFLEPERNRASVSGEHWFLQEDLEEVG